MNRMRALEAYGAIPGAWLGASGPSLKQDIPKSFAH